jgi:hypothetical protein
MFVESQIADPTIHSLSIRLAKQCRNVVQSCLREEEWRDCDLEFYKIIRAGLEGFAQEQFKHILAVDSFQKYGQHLHEATERALDRMQGKEGRER